MSQRVRHLIPCPACHRHVMNDEAGCPFCAAPLPACTCAAPQRARPRGRLGRAALLAAGASATLIGACSHSVAPPYGISPIVDSGSMSDTTDGGADGSGGSAGAGGGAEASGGAGGTGTTTDGES